MIFLNPFQDIISVTEQLYGKQKCTIQFDPTLGKRKGQTLGETFFPFDGSRAVVSVSSRISVDAALEILAHELAHVVCGITEQHGKKWEKVFRKIVREYNRAMIKKAKTTNASVKY